MSANISVFMQNIKCKVKRLESLPYSLESSRLSMLIISVPVILAKIKEQKKGMIKEVKFLIFILNQAVYVMESI